jgi:hypothetical protein
VRKRCGNCANESECLGRHGVKCPEWKDVWEAHAARAEAIDQLMTTLREVQLTTAQLEALGLSPDWNQHLDRQFIAHLLSVIERNREAEVDKA